MVKERKINKLEDLRRSELIAIIRIYNKENIIKKYHALSKVKLIELINKHILMSPDLKQIQPKINNTNLVEYDKFKNVKIDKKLSNKDERKLYKERGRQRAIILKLKEELADMDVQIDGNYKLKNNADFMKNYNEKNELLKIESKKLKSINDLIIKNEKLNNS